MKKRTAMAHPMSLCAHNSRKVRKSELTSAPGNTELKMMWRVPFFNLIPTVNICFSEAFTFLFLRLPHSNS